jgi:hypothetical protein
VVGSCLGLKSERLYFISAIIPFLKQEILGYQNSKTEVDIPKFTWTIRKET